ncbi:hypothetical protein [Sphingomonas pituitosa]|uniref:hypothetical protein n=1 Tax=Sphingomonas pituitosa TaxID=99597 RepID=UPI000829A790|nr:hypothetical protein [Sphingomonas pituitosa]
MTQATDADRDAAKGKVERAEHLRSEIRRCNIAIESGTSDPWWYEDRGRFQQELDELERPISTSHREASTAALTAEVEREKVRIAEVMEEDGGCWTACSGCQESCDGCVSTKDYPYDARFRCQPGSGCRECGGIGVIWQDGKFLSSYGNALSTINPISGGEAEKGIPAKSAQYFFEIGFMAAFAEVTVGAGKAPFPLTDRIVDKAWADARDGVDDPAEWDAHLSATPHPSGDAAREALERHIQNASEPLDAMTDAVVQAIEAWKLNDEEAIDEAMRNCLARIAQAAGRYIEGAKR